MNLAGTTVRTIVVRDDVISENDVANEGESGEGHEEELSFEVPVATERQEHTTEDSQGTQHPAEPIICRNKW